MTTVNTETQEYKQGDVVRVSGYVEWGDREYRVATEAVIEEWGKGDKALLTLEYVDGDYGVTIYVDKQNVYPVN